MRRLSLALLAVAVALGTTRAEDDPQALNKARLSAIEGGIAWLRKAQAGDGSWELDKAKPLGVGIQMKHGCTALCALALLKSGVKADDPAIEKAFDYLCTSKGTDYVYADGCVLLAIEARYHWEPPPATSDPDDLTTRARDPRAAPRKPRNLTPRELELAERCKEFLLAEQTPNGSWSYPLKSPKGDEKSDASHPQYALLGLDAAEKLGLKVPRDPYLRAVAYFVDHQEKDGPEVPPFPVPGADLSFKELARIEKELRDRIQRVEADFNGKKPDETNASGHTEEDELHTVARDTSDKVLKTREKAKMLARGWCYAYPPAKLEGFKTVVDGSMTASALTSLFVCKAHLDAAPEYEKLRASVDRSLRDGCAWIAHHFSVTRNPAEDDKACLNHYYYLYGLERAGILGLVPAFGEHDWYLDGCKTLVAAQKKDGAWDAGATGTAGPVPDTCFALLFLCRGTTPFVKIPTRTATGLGR
jgi:hypothetical protein